jgi:glycosyltransferase involved in cell wall biosynthesis
MRRRATRVAYVVDNAGIRAAERTVLQLAGGLSRSRFEVGVVCRPGGHFVQRLHDMGVPVLAADMPRALDRESILGITRELRRYDPDIVHMLGAADPLMRIAVRLARPPAVVSSLLKMPGLDERPWRRTLGRVVDLVTDRLVDRYVVTSQSALEALADRSHVSAAKVVVIPHGVGLAPFDSARAKRGSWLVRLGIPAQAVVLGALGRLTPDKGFSMLIRTFAALERRDVWLVIAGEGPEWEELHALAQAYEVSDRILFLGFVDDVPGLLADIDVFVLPSPAEGHSLVLLEAMAMARPVVAVDAAGVGDTIADGVEGRTVSQADVASLAQAIDRMIADPENARRMGHNARRKVEREYTVGRMVQRTAVLYGELLAEKGER